MAFINTVQYGQERTLRANPSRLAPSNVADGEVEFTQIDYTVAGTESSTSTTNTNSTEGGTPDTTGDVINLMTLVQGAIPRPDLSSIQVNQANGTMTVDIGTRADQNGWASGVNTGAVGLKPCVPPAAAPPAWAAARVGIVPDPIEGNFVSNGNAIVYARVKSATTLVAGTVIRFNLAWQRNK